MTATMTATQYQASWNPDEAEFQRDLLKEANRFGWMCWHDHDSRRNDAGWPDLVCAKPGRPLIIWELKSNTGRVRRSQRAWLAVLDQVPGIMAGIKRPRDWDDVLAVLMEDKP